MAHFLLCTDSLTIEEIASFFLYGIYILHGVPRVLVSNRDPEVVSGLWLTFWLTSVVMIEMRHKQQVFPMPTSQRLYAHNKDVR
jgi:hypothetical protein